MSGFQLDGPGYTILPIDKPCIHTYRAVRVYDKFSTHLWSAAIRYIISPIN